MHVSKHHAKGSISGPSTAASTRGVRQLLYNRLRRCTPTVLVADHSPTRSILFFPLSSGEEKLISAHVSGTVRVWSRSMAPSVSFCAHTSAVNRITCLRQQQLLLTCGNDMSLRLWDLNSNARLPIATFNTHSGYVTDCDTSDSNPLIVSTSTDDTIRFWHPQFCDRQVMLIQPRFTQHSVRFLPGLPHVLLTTSVDGAHLWDVRTLKCYATLRAESGCSSFTGCDEVWAECSESWTDNGHQNGDIEQTCGWLYKIDDTTSAAEQAHDHPSADFSPPEPTRFFSRFTGRYRRPILSTPQFQMYCAQPSDDGLFVMTSALEQKTHKLRLVLWSLHDMRAIAPLMTENDLACPLPSLSSDSRFAMCAANGGIRLWELDKYLDDSPLRSDGSAIQLRYSSTPTCTAWARDASEIAVGSVRGDVYLLSASASVRVSKNV